MAVYNGKGLHLDKVAKRSRGQIEAAAQGLWEGVVKAREGLSKASKAKQSSSGSGGDAGAEKGASGGGKGDRWLVDVQLSQWRRDEREASTEYCKQVLELTKEARKCELECVGALQEVLSAYMQAQCASISKLDLDLEAVARGLKLLDGDADWDSFESLPTIEAVKSGRVGSDWREWKVDATRQALSEGERGDIMAGEGAEGVEKAGWLHRQGTLLSFNWHKQWFVITKYGHMYYFANKQSTVPEVGLSTYIHPSLPPSLPPSVCQILIPKNLNLHISPWPVPLVGQPSPRRNCEP